MTQKPELKTTDDIRAELIQQGIIQPDDETDYATAILLIYRRLSDQDKLLVLDVARALAEAKR